MVDNKPKPLSSPTECLAQLLRTEEYADLNITLPETEKTLKVHRMILAMWSPVFKAMLFGPMCEGESINLPEDNPDGFKFLLEYMYRGCTELPSVDLAVHVYMLANKYQMDHLKTLCSEYLKSSVTAVCVPQVMNIATLIEDEDLIDKCTQIIHTSADSVFLSPSVGSLSSQSLNQILNQELYISSETIVFQGILTWGRTQLKLRGEEITSKSIRQEIDQFLPQVRFLTMTTSEFVKNVLPEYILTIEELTRIQQLQENVQGIDIPKACSDSKEPRRRFDKSQLKSMLIKYGSQIRPHDQSIQYGEGTERVYISEINCKKAIYLNEFEYISNIGDQGQLLVRDSSQRDIASVEFDGCQATFQTPLRLVPGQIYSFVLKGQEKSVYSNKYTIADNNILSGNLSCYVTNFTIHYWE